MIQKATVVLMVLLVASMGCKRELMKDQTNKTEVIPVFTPGPPALVYKTRADYSDKLAITLNEHKTAVVAYPHPADIRRAAGLPYPTKLAEGYLLDNQGINAHVAFTSYTLQEYASLPDAPSVAELLERVIDKDPLLYMCNCGNRMQYEDAIAAMNKLVTDGFSACKPVVE